MFPGGRCTVLQVVLTMPVVVFDSRAWFRLCRICGGAASQFLLGCGRRRVYAATRSRDSQVLCLSSYDRQSQWTFQSQQRRTVSAVHGGPGGDEG